VNLLDSLRPSFYRCGLLQDGGDMDTVTVMRMHDHNLGPYELDPYALDGEVLRITVQVKKFTPASKPADPAFKHALRRQHMQIGLRYLGD
jgi:hypothetical protein